MAIKSSKPDSKKNVSGKYSFSLKAVDELTIEIPGGGYGLKQNLGRLWKSDLTIMENFKRETSYLGPRLSA